MNEELLTHSCMDTYCKVLPPEDKYDITGILQAAHISTITKQITVLLSQLHNLLLSELHIVERQNNSPYYGFSQNTMHIIKLPRFCFSERSTIQIFKLIYNTIVSQLDDYDVYWLSLTNIVNMQKCDVTFLWFFVFHKVGYKKQ